MSLWDKVRGELIDVIEWTDPTGDTMVHRFERHGNEIKNGAQLTVREGQAAVFIDEGELADVFEPGMYTLETANLPVLSTLRGWKYGFESPFKAEVYFVSTRQFTDQKWGTKNPVMLRDPEFGPVRLRAFGTYAVRVKDAASFIKEIVGTDGTFTADEITGQIRNILVARFSDALGESGIPVLDMASKQDELGTALSGRVQKDIDTYGLELRTLLVENISLPQAVEEALDKRTSMGVVGDLRAFTQYQAAEALGDAAKNPGAGGLAAGGLAAGLGMAMGNQLAQGLNPPAAPAGGPPPLPGAAQYYAGIGGKQAGPFAEAALAEEIRAGRITRETLVWTQGMSDWRPAADIEAIAKLFGAAPPPLPST